MTPKERTALIEMLNYLADEESHYESCSEEERPNHIWEHREVLRRMLESSDNVSCK